MHADFWNTWDQAKLDELVSSCLNAHIDCGKVASTPTLPSTSSLTATPGEGVVSLSWTPPLSDGGSPLTGYAIYRSTDPAAETDASPPTPLATLTPDQTSYDDTAVTGGTTYYYRMAAQNDQGEGPLSFQKAAVPIGPPGPPILTARKTVIKPPGIKLTWTLPPNGGSPLTAYRIYRGRIAGRERLLVEVGTVRKYRDTNVRSGKRYIYYITALNDIGEGTRSNRVRARAP
jgi:fibronectin type 3 domain-containing protein